MYATTTDPWRAPADHAVDGGDPPRTVVDVGGTTLRVGDYHPPGEPGAGAAAGSVSRVRRVPADGMARHPQAPVPVLQRRVVDQLAHEIARHQAGRPRPVGIAFAGPVTGDGLVLTAPTIWGRRGAAVPLRRLLQDRLGVPVTVVNDVTAAAWRYAAVEPEPFCLLTVSSGIGNKVFRHDEVLLDAEGHGGELGHWVCDPSPDAPLCDCGGRGHLGGIASGRGVLAAVRRAAADDPAGFGRSVLWPLSGGTPDGIDNPAVAHAVRGGDPFATDVLRGTLTHLARAITAVFTSIGVRRYLIMGGFALAIGERYRELLVAELLRLGCFGLDPAQVDGMVALAESDDDHGLIGVGRLLAHRTAALATPSAAGAR